MIPTNFEAMGLDENLLLALKAVDYTIPSPIQAQAIPIALEGKDLIGQAQTGTGKTAAFGIPMIQNLSKTGNHTKGLVLCPTRELCIQVANELKKLSAFTKNITIHAIYGGDPIVPQIKALKNGVDIVVGTPGRVQDHIDRGTLNLTKLEILALDEADEMLNMGFIDDLEVILETVPEERQTILFSATMPKEILKIAKNYQKDPELIKITPSALTAVGIEQRYIDTDMKTRYRVLQFLLNHNEFNQAIVFCNTKAKVDELSSELAEARFKNEVLHGDLGQDRRTSILNKFRDGIFKVLIATDVAARGIDIPNVDLVVNYDIPMDPEYYVHRIGRTGRAGKKGEAFSFIVGARDKRLIRQIENFAKVEIQRYKLPDAKELADLEAGKLKKNIIDVIESKKNQSYLELAKNIVPAGASPLEVISAILCVFVPPTKADWPQPSSFSEPNNRDRKSSSNRRIDDRRGGQGKRTFGRDRRGRFSDSPRESNNHESSSRDGRYGSRNEDDKGKKSSSDGRGKYGETRSSNKDSSRSSMNSYAKKPESSSKGKSGNSDKPNFDFFKSKS